MCELSLCRVFRQVGIAAHSPYAQNNRQKAHKKRDGSASLAPGLALRRSAELSERPAAIDFW